MADFVMQWEFVRSDRVTGRYSIKSVRFLKFAGCSKSGHPDGELVQSSDSQMLWKVEGAPGSEKVYRCVLFISCHNPNTNMSARIQHLDEGTYWGLEDFDDNSPVSAIAELTLID